MDFHKVNKLWNYLKTCLELIKFCEFGGKKLATKLAADEIKKKVILCKNVLMAQQSNWSEKTSCFNFNSLKLRKVF